LPRFALPEIIIVSSISAYSASVNRGDLLHLQSRALDGHTVVRARLAEYGINIYEFVRHHCDRHDRPREKTKYDKLIAEGLTPIQRWGTPEDVGKAVTAIAQDLLPSAPGEVINVDGGFHLRRVVNPNVA